MNIPLALQLFTVRDETAKDFIGTLEKVAKIGYTGVEFAGFGDIAPNEMKKALDDLGLKAMGSHTGRDLVFDRLDEVIEYNLIIGNKYVIIPYDKYDTKEKWLEAIWKYEEAGRKLKKDGLVLCYHNHAHEFETYDGEYILDIIFNKTSADNVLMELDTYWVHFAGVDPLAYLDKYKGRCPLVHLKDMRADDRDTAEVGEGIIDIKAIIAASEKAGAEWFVVEQDRTRRPTLESAGISYKNLKKWGTVL